MLAMMETRQEEAVRRIAYGRIDSAPHSATSLSSNNSSNSFTASVGQRPANPGGRVRQYFEQQRVKADSSASSGKGVSPVGWDKSYPLKPVNDPGLPPSDHQGRPIYKRNNATVSGRNKYSGNYGPKSQANAPQNYYKGRGYSLDRNRSRVTSPARGGPSAITRARSQVLLGANGFSSGEDSYGSSSRPPSRDWSNSMYSSRSHKDLISVSNRNNLLNGDAPHYPGSHHLSRSNSRSNMNYGQWVDNEDVIDGKGFLMMFSKFHRDFFDH